MAGGQAGRGRRGSRGDGVLRLDDLEIDVEGRLAVRAGRRIDLSATEFGLLVLLVQNAGIVLSRFDIYDHVWSGTLDVESKTLDVYVGYLRRKTEQGDAPRIIQTVRGIGYVARTDR